MHYRWILYCWATREAHRNQIVPSNQGLHWYRYSSFYSLANWLVQRAPSLHNIVSILCLLSNLLCAGHCAEDFRSFNPINYFCKVDTIIICSVQFSSVQLLSRVRLFATPWTAARQASLSITNSQSLLILMSTESVMPSNHLILCCPLLFFPSIFPKIRVFSDESVLHIRWPKYWSFSSSISPANEYSGLISFRMDWLDLLAVQGTLKTLLQHHSSKASILQCSAFFTVQLSHPYMATGKTIALTRQTFVGKVMSLLFNVLSRLVITFLPRSKRLLISWLQSPSAVILEPPQNKVSHCFHYFPIYLPWSNGTGCHDLSFLSVEL